VPDWEGEYVLFDCPGQVELFTHHASLRRIFARLERGMGYRVRFSHIFSFRGTVTVSTSRPFFLWFGYCGGLHRRIVFALVIAGALRRRIVYCHTCTGGLCDAKKREVRMYSVLI
jgi:hypothetical protein